MDQAIQNKLDEIVRRIVDIFHPLRIVLFGSAARGQMGPNSDLDILVVMPDGTHRRHTAMSLYPLMKGLGIPVDFVVATPSDLEKHKNEWYLVYSHALREGKELYAA